MMTLSEIIMISAIFLAPIFAVQAQKLIERFIEARKRRLDVFRTLMATRATILSPIHVQYLNLIDIEFCGKSKKDRRVIEAWKLYLDHLGHASKKDEPDPNWGKEREELLIDLLYEMSKAVGFKFDKVLIKRGAYYPEGHGVIEDEQTIIRKNLVKLLSGDRSIPMEITNFPVSEERIERQKELNEKLLECFDGKRPLPVKIINEAKNQEE